MPGPGPAFDPNNDTISSAFPLFNGSVLQHQVRVGPGKKLAQGTTYFFIITAGTTTPGDRPTTATGSFTTGSRNALVKFESIRVWRDGEPWGNGDMRFYFTAYDGQDKSFLANAPIYPDQDFADIGDGDYVPVNRDVFIQNAPAALTLECFGYDEDDDLFSASRHHRPRPRLPGDIAANGPPTERRRHDMGDCPGTYDLPTSTMTATPPPLTSRCDPTTAASRSRCMARSSRRTVGVGFAMRRAELGQRWPSPATSARAATVVTGPERLDLLPAL